MLAGSPAPGSSRSSPAMATKKVGGPARKLTRSGGHQAQGLDRVETPDQDRAQPAGPGDQHPLSSPETWAIGAGMSTASAGPSSWTPDHQRGLPREGSVGVQDGLGLARRPRGEQHHRQVRRLRPGAPPAAPVCRRAARSAGRSGSEARSGASSTTRAGSTWPSAAATRPGPRYGAPARPPPRSASRRGRGGRR